MRRVLLGAALSLLLAGPVQAEEAAWEPDGGARSAQTRAGVQLDGLTALQRLRVHLRLGGYIEGAVGAYDPERGELLLLYVDGEPGQLWLDRALVDAITPLQVANLPTERVPVPQRAREQVQLERRLMPTWRSHAGAVMSAFLPGLGQFVQQRDQGLGPLFLAGEAFFVTAGLLSLLGPNDMDPSRRGITAGLFFGVAGSLHVTSSALAYHTGLEERRVPVQEAAPGLQ